jgi:Fe-S-cluster containining protein
MNNEQPNNNSASCRRCGECCRKGGPALHFEDRLLVDKGILAFSDLVAIRLGEPAYDPLGDKVTPSGSEFIKIMGQGSSWSCRFFDPGNNGCAIYENRPLECRLLFCREPEELENVIGKNLLTRRDLIPGEEPIIKLIDRLEQECGYQTVNNLLTGTAGIRDDIVERLSEMVGRDLAIRDEFLRTFPERRTEEMFLFGRPLFLVLAPYGFRLLEDEEGIRLEFTPS